MRVSEMLTGVRATMAIKVYGDDLKTLEEKTESGEILIDLTIKQNSTEEEQARIELSIPTYEQDFLPNFRKGDIVILAIGSSC